MATGDERERVLEEERPGPEEERLGPSDLESVLLEDTLKEVQVTDGLVLDEHASLYDAVRIMRQNGQGCVLVTRGDRLIGIFTEHDVLMKIVDTGIDLSRTPLLSYMTPNPVSLPADIGVVYALNKMVLEGFHRLPVVDSEGRPTGIVSMRDIVEYLASFFPKDILNLPPDPTKTFRHREGG